MKPRIKPSDTIFNSEFETPPRNKKPALDSTIKKSERRCTCRKSQCLKMYCDCLAAGELCGPTCGCSNCHNSQQFINERNSAMEQSQSRQQSVPRKLCNCRKSRCQKKYCECFNAGLKCSEHCRCDDCGNSQGLTHKNAKQVKEFLTQCEALNQKYVLISREEYEKMH